MFHKIFVLQVHNKTGIHLIFHNISSSLSASHFLFYYFFIRFWLQFVLQVFNNNWLENKNIGAASFLKSLHPSLHLIFISILYYILIAVCVCKKKYCIIHVTPLFFPFLLRVQGLLLKTQKLIYLFKFLNYFVLYPGDGYHILASKMQIV